MKSTIILTVHNKAELLRDHVLPALAKFTNWVHSDLIVVLDGCTDDSEAEVLSWAKKQGFYRFKLIHTPDVFETKANNAGLREATGDYVIILQDDMVVNEKDWNVRLLEPFTWLDVFAVSANCAHNWELNPDSQGTKDGWSDLLNHIDHANKNNIPRNVFAIRDSVNRGPLAIDRELLVKMKYFDEDFAPLDSDDHDLMYRMRKSWPWKVCGFYAVEWYSRPEWGGTRDSDGKQKQWALDAQIKNTQLLYDRHKDVMNTHQKESRTL